MRSFIVTALLVSCLAFTALGDQTCIANAETKYFYCNGNYSAVNKTSSTRAEICSALSTYVSCLGDLASCDVAWTSTWFGIIQQQYQGDWLQYGCDMSISTSGSARSAMVWGDPHYSMFNGSYASCQNTGSALLASGLHWSVTATFVAADNSAANNGSYVSSVSVNFFHPAFAGVNNNFTFTGSRLPNAGTVVVNEEDAFTITVTNSSIKAPGFGLTVFVDRIDIAESVFQVGIVARNIVGGDLLTGCPTQTVNNDDARAFQQADDISDMCSELNGNFQTSCVYDAPRMGSFFAVYTSAQAQILAYTSVRQEMENQNGNGAAAHATWCIAFVSALIGLTMIW